MSVGIRTAGNHRPFLLSATVDFHSNVEYQGVHTLAQLDAMMSCLREIGFRRVNWLYYGDIDPASELYSPIFDSEHGGRETISLIGEPLLAAVPLAHRHGLEIYGVLKPFHGGSTVTWPEGSPQATATALPRIGGRLRDTDAYLVDDPSLRIARRQDSSDPSDWAAARTRIAEIRLVKADDGITRIRREDLEIWTSPDNFAYRRRDLPFAFRDEVRPAIREVVDYYGNVLTRAGDPVRVLSLSGLDLDDRFVLLTTTFRDGPADFRNSPLGMVEAVGHDGRILPIVVASRSATAYSTRDFRVDGLEFDCGYGTFPIGLDEDNAAAQTTWSVPQGGCVAFAVGKNSFLAAAPCESDPKVQRIWLRRIGRMIEAGVDGVDIRVSAHGSLTDEPFAYGFNPIILEECQRRSGSLRRDRSVDVTLLSSIRGDAYTGFLRAARKLLREAGVPMQLHLHAEAFQPDPPHGALMGFPANLRFDWAEWLEEGLADATTLRMAWYEGMEPTDAMDLRERLRDPAVEEMLEATCRNHIPVYLNRYAMAGGVTHKGEGMDRYLEDIEVAYGDPRLAGFDVYEVFTLVRPGADGRDIEPIGDLAERLRRKARRLGIT